MTAPLTPEEERIILHKGTETPFSGEYRNYFEPGTYICRKCGNPLYRSSDKFDSECGRPSFEDAFPGAVHRSTDADGMRTEITCANCWWHLGHVFIGEQMTEKNTRHCVNSLSIRFISDASATGLSAAGAWNEPPTLVATFGGGCFRCLEAAFQQLRWVLQVMSGYAGGKRAYPSYDQVSTWATGHVEVVQITYDPNIISYKQLTEIFFTLHDPTTLNRQWHDTGTQYASVIFYHDNSQKVIAEEVIADLTAQQIRSDPIVTQLRALEKFRIAEGYHQNYYMYQSQRPYCQMVISPKLSKLRERRKDLLKK